MTLEEIIELIGESREVVSSKKLNIGWSDEEKYILTCTSGARLLLRLLSKDSYISQLEPLMKLEKFAKKSDNVPKVLGYGVASNNKTAYILLEFIEGECAMQEITKFSSLEQYNFGLVMGKTIKEFHNQSTLRILKEESEKFACRVLGFVEFYQNNQEKYSFLRDKDKQVLKFLEKIKNEPMIMLHNDFHLGNMIIGNGKISLIDFNRATYGMGIKEFDGIAWSVRSSKFFAQGLVDAYIDSQDESEFFELLHGFINIWQLQMLVFIENQDDDEKKEVIELLKFAESWYSSDSNIPNWYLDED